MKEYLPLILIIASVLLFIFIVTLFVLNPNKKPTQPKKEKVKKVEVERVSPPLKQSVLSPETARETRKVNYLALITFFITSVILTIIFFSEEVLKWQLFCFIIGYVVIISSFNEGKNKENQVVRLGTLIIGLLLVDAALFPLLTVNPKILYYMIGLPLILFVSHRVITFYILFSPVLILFRILTFLLLIGLGVVSIIIFGGPLFILIGVFFFIGAFFIVGFAIFSLLAKVMTF